MKFYHASPRRFRHGDILTGNKPGGIGYGHQNVCLTTSPIPHATIASLIPDWSGHYYNPDSIPMTGHTQPVVDKDWFVYEVEPLAKVGYVEGNSEYQTRAARVVKNLGKASALLKHYEQVAKERGVGALPPDAERDRQEKARARKQRHLQRRDQWGELHDPGDDEEGPSAARVAAIYLLGLAR